MNNSQWLQKVNFICNWRLGFHALFCHLLLMRTWTCHLTSLSLTLSFPYQSERNNVIYLAGSLWIGGCVWHQLLPLTGCVTMRKTFKPYASLVFLSVRSVFVCECAARGGECRSWSWIRIRWPVWCPHTLWSCNCWTRLRFVCSEVFCIISHCFLLSSSFLSSAVPLRNRYCTTHFARIYLT